MYGMPGLRKNLAQQLMGGGSPLAGSHNKHGGGLRVDENGLTKWGRRLPDGNGGGGGGIDPGGTRMGGEIAPVGGAGMPGALGPFKGGSKGSGKPRSMAKQLAGLMGWGRKPAKHLLMAQWEGANNPMSGDTRAAYLAPHTQALDQAYTAGQGLLDRALAARGLSDSSAMATGQAVLAQGRADAGAGLVSRLQLAEQERSDLAKQQLYSNLMQMMGLGTKGADISLALREMAMRNRLAEEQSEDSGLAGVFGGLGSFLGGPLANSWFG